MSKATDQNVRGALLNSWDRSDTILLGLLGALPEGAWEVRAMEGRPRVAELFTPLHHVRLVFVAENPPEEEWANGRDPGRTAQMLESSARVVRGVVRGRVEAGQDLSLGHGQTRLVLKLTGRPMPDQEAGPVTWGVRMRRTRGSVERSAVARASLVKPVSLAERRHRPFEGGT